MNLGDLGAPLAVGNTAKVYLFENKIIKVFNDNLPYTESMNEANRQEYAYSCGLYVPKVLDVIKLEEDKQAIVMEYIKGETIGNLLSDNPEQAEYYMNISIDLQRKVHQNEADSIDLMSEKLSRQINSAPYLGDELKSSLLDKLGSMVFEKRLCHGDFHLFNLIKSDDKVAIIDWGDASAGDLRADIYRTYLLYSQLSMDLADMYLHLYCKKSGLSKGEILKWAPIIAAARLSECVTTERPERLLDIVNDYPATEVE
ncbi:aminoglycoside phosphotransferase family protein [Halobacillus litoralis]|uniref:Aminoglycoside phosphotransferase n=1 Tax=Halobacillus litoralis TaxID=45668 RepID=A0A410M9U4_9BACI|nr:aminoglycoside phosphotransferase family protein [Halobacillus litoralis]QAS51501.1 aminoglycoside phosphotransferase [Halobacillus litoralis]